MIKHYIYLQYKIANRRLKSYGFHPFVAYPLLFIVFTVFSFLLFYPQIIYLQYFYLLIPFYFSFNLAEPGRNDFLKICFNDKMYKMIRIMENLMIALPFIAFLLYKRCYLLAFLLTVLMIFSALANTRTRFSFVIPTPFAKNPFEFTVGFRNTFYLFVLAYGLTVIAIVVNNFNLVAFALLLTLLVPCGFYLKPENPYYVWQFSLSPAQFLYYKMKTALVYSFRLSLPIILTLSLFYPGNAWIPILCFLLGYIFLILFIVIKYASFPDEPGILEGIAILLCFFIPPLLLIIIPYYFNQSVKQLQTLLP
ncbi:MAG: hypothetical protein FWF53_03285 [Candidatus Azobacteroides sp.]|nr:hypothetical protein [Candidatus Azobacteroides sp.]